MSRILSLGAVVGCLSLSVGCAADPRPPSVTGRVTFQGEPLPAGVLRLKALTPGRQVDEAQVRLNPDGTYAVTDAPLGPVAVSIDTEIIQADLKLAALNPDSQPLQVRYVPIPKRYRTYETSKLDFEIKPGAQTHDFTCAP